MDWTCYVLITDDNTRTYCGITNNMDNRLNKHNSGMGAKATKGRKWNILFTIIGFKTKNECMSFEYKLKHHKRLSNDIKENRINIANKLIANHLKISIY
jgi:putative endonuclease